MSRRVSPLLGGLPGFPRVSGDEPRWDQICKALDTFSPRERG